MKKLLLIITIFILNLTSNAQTIGEWTSHTPGHNIIGVEKMHEKVFTATPYDIFYYNTNDNSINHLSKVNGLSDIGVNVIKYNEDADMMFVGYSNTNIDIIDSQLDITNIPDIYNKYILGNKTINDVYFNGQLAYVCCGFGIVVINLQHNEVYDTYFFRYGDNYIGVNDLTICDSIFYAATDHGIFYAETSNTHLADFSQWTQFRHDLPYVDDNFSQIELFDGYVVAVHSDNEHYYDEFYAISDTTSWHDFFPYAHGLITDMRVNDDLLVLSESYSKIRVYDKDLDLVFSFENDDIKPRSTLYDKTSKYYWTGTTNTSLVKFYSKKKYEIIPFSGPYSANSFSINASGSDLWVAAGGYRSTWSKLGNEEGFSHYDGDSWEFFNKNTTSVLDTITDIVCVKSDPNNDNIVYAATFGKGLLVFENGKFKTNYNYYNSSLQLHESINYTYVTGFDFDSNNNMWLANSGASKMLSVWNHDGTWMAYNIGKADIGTLMVDKNDIKWIYKRVGEIIVFKDGVSKTINDAENTGHLPGDANCFATDNNGTVWIGTSDGVALFYNTNKIFSSNSFKCSRILIPRNDGSGQADYLLSGLSVLSIAVDGANNLWFGTNNGVIQTSNDGQTTYHHFTMENSPLFSNTVTDIAIDDDGIVYFATDKGVISYRGTASKGNTKNTNVVVFPNPVRPEHKGIVGIKGLVTNALVKITTTNGAFVTHLRAQGGQAVWDCTDINGTNVQPGIYLIFVSDETGKETYATKVLIMK